MSRAFLPLILILLCTSLCRADWGLGLGYPYVSVKDDFGRSAAEGKFATGYGINLIAGRGYWNFCKFNPVTLFTGAEGGYIKFNTQSTKGTGWEASAFVGGEMPLAHWLSLAVDFSPMYINLKSQGTGVSGMEYAVNFAIYIYPFRGSSDRAQDSSKETKPSTGPAEPAATASTTTTPAPIPAVSTATPAAVPSDQFDSLIKALKDADPAARAQAATALGKLGNSSAVEPLIAALQDQSSAVRGAAANSLGKFSDTHAVEPLIALLQDPDAKVRALAARALGRLGDNRALAPLQQVAMDADAVVRDKAQEAVKGLSSALPVAAESNDASPIQRASLENSMAATAGSSGIPAKPGLRASLANPAADTAGFPAVPAKPAQRASLAKPSANTDGASVIPAKPVQQIFRARPPSDATDSPGSSNKPVQRVSREQSVADDGKWKTVHQLEFHAGRLYPGSTGYDPATQGTMLGVSYLAQFCRHFAMGIEVDDLKIDPYQALQYALIAEVGSSFAREHLGFGIRLGFGDSHVTTTQWGGSYGFGDRAMAMGSAGLWISPVKPLRLEVRYGLRNFRYYSPYPVHGISDYFQMGGQTKEVTVALSVRFGAK